MTSHTVELPAVTGDLRAYCSTRCGTLSVSFIGDRASSRTVKRIVCLSACDRARMSAAGVVGAPWFSPHVAAFDGLPRVAWSSPTDYTVWKNRSSSLRGLSVQLMQLRENRMSTRSVNPAIARPRCRFCSRPWTPAEGVSAEQAHCPLCSESRHAVATKAFGLRPLVSADFDGQYLLPPSRRTA